MIDLYLKGALLLSDEKIRKQHEEIKQLIKRCDRIVFIGNGGSHPLHLSHDFLKVLQKPTLSIDNPSLLSCLLNDYDKEDTYLNWFKVQRRPGDLVIALSSSGESLNVINVVRWASLNNDKVITITGFSADNKLNKLGDVNVHLNIDSFGCHEIYALAFMHSILDDLVEEKKNGLYKEYVPEERN